jgi:hypothetical protein
MPLRNIEGSDSNILMTKTTGKVALVIGGSRGIGAAIPKRLAAMSVDRKSTD